MKILLFLVLCFFSVSASIFDKAIDISNEPLVLKRGVNSWFKVGVSERKTWHAESDNPDLKFNELGGIVFGNYQYFRVTCRRNCKAGDSCSFILTETLDSARGSTHIEDVLAYQCYIA